MDEVVLDGKTYIGSKKAAQECGYTQDYVGQLARKGLIEAQRVSGQWYVLLISLKNYKSNAESFKPEPPKYQPDPNVEATIQVEGKEYVSAARAAKITEYNQDYVGQLARAGKVPSRQIGNRWYVERDALLAHKQEKDAMLRAVQAEAVGLKKVETFLPPSFTNAIPSKAPQQLLIYKTDNKPLFPEISEEHSLKAIPLREKDLQTIPCVRGESKIPIKVLRQIEIQVPQLEIERTVKEEGRNKVSIPRKSRFKGIFLSTAIAAVILLAVGIGTYERHSIYSFVSGETNLSQTASAALGSSKISHIIDRLLTKEIVYIRQ